MDLWVVAAVAGAGYLAKYLNRLSNNVDSSSHLSSEDSGFENTVSPSHPFCKQAREDELGNGVFLDRRDTDVTSLEGLLTIELASNKGLDGEQVRCFGNCNESDVLSVSNFNDIEDGNQQSSNVGGNCGFLLPDLSAGELGHVHDHSREKTFIRTKHLYGHNIRPLNCLESCLMAQLCKENANMEEYVTSSSTATRSFRVIDGSQIISRTNYDDCFNALTGSEEYKLCREASQVKDGNELFQVPSLPKIGSFSDAKKMKFNAVNGRSRRLSSPNIALSGKHIRAQHNTTFLFSLGISFGIITSILGSKGEMDKLKQLLKQTENLVQDLQEELEMKDSMTVKELHSENYGSQDTCDHSFYDKDLNGFSLEKHMDSSLTIECKRSYDQKEEESSESMSKIEAELETELERLGLNMSGSSPERTLSEVVELDPDFVAVFAQGELRTDMISGKDFIHPRSNMDASDTMIFPEDYAVSPHELSLRLHEVIQSRLEERVQELEAALQNSQRKLQIMESECEGRSQSQKYLPSRGHDPMAEPLVMNLSGEESLGAYNEAYEELTKMDDSEENLPSGIPNTDHKVGSRSHDWHVLGVQYCGAKLNEGRLSRELSSSEVTVLEGQSSSICELNDVTGDEHCDSDYEVERQLIRQIVDRTKKGSPVFQNVRRILYSMGEHEH